MEISEPPKDVVLFFKKYGKDTTNNFQLLKWGKQLKIKPFKVIMRDEIKYCKPEDYVITNIQKTNENGVHWLCFHDKYYFDSYGLPPLKEYKDLVKHGIFSEFNIQDFNQSFCGQLALFVLYKLFKGETFEDIILNIYSYKNKL